MSDAVERAARHARLCVEHLRTLRVVLRASRGELPLTELSTLVNAEAAMWLVIAALEGNDGRRKGNST
jgi:hypothetical protein